MPYKIWLIVGSFATKLFPDISPMICIFIGEYVVICTFLFELHFCVQIATAPVGY